MKRLVPPLLVVLMIQGALGACGDSGDTGDSGGTVAAKRWSVDGLSFENPHGYKEVDPDTLADAASGNEDIDDLADDMGIETDALVEVMGQFDLYLLGALSAPGFVDNVSVVEQPGGMPTKSQVRSELDAVGARLLAYDKVGTDLGEVVTASYELAAGKARIEGETIVADVDGAVWITISSADRDTTDDVAQGILETLDED